MLSKYETEIRKLSIKKIDYTVATAALDKLKNLLPTSTRQCEKILEAAVKLLSINIKNKNYKTTFGLLRFIFFTNFKNPIQEVKKQGALRSSKANFQTNLITELINEILKSDTLSKDNKNYLHNIKLLLLLAPEMRDTRGKIIAAASSRRYFLKTVLALAETTYNDLLYHQQPEQNSADILFKKNKENILSAISYVVQTYRESVGNIKIQDSNGIDESTTDDYYTNIFTDAYSIVNFLECEIRVDCFDYQVICNNEKSEISVINTEFETAKTHGYVKTLLRQQSQTKQISDETHSESYMSFLEKFWAADSKQNESFIYSIKKTPAERIVLVAPLLEYGHKANIFSQDYAFKEELIQLHSLTSENYNTKLLTEKICESFTVFDILKIQRLFGYTSFIYNKAYETLQAAGDSNASMIRRRSVLPVFDAEQLVDIFEKTTGRPKRECEILLEKLASGEPAANEVIDLQYRPIIKFAHRYLVLPTVFARSNLVRSLALTGKVHLSVVDKLDYMVKTVTKALVDQGFTTKHDFKFGVDEIDIAATYGEHLFLFECKNPYHPVNDFELRNTFSHITKGFSQLEKFKKLFENKNTLKQFLLNIKIEPTKIKNIHYGIINANRALTGLQKNGITVFHANELINFINSGVIFSDKNLLHCWENKNFQANDLISYMTGKVITNDLISHKSEFSFSFKFKRWSLKIKTFEYDLTSTAFEQNKKYRRID